jgi:eukaryotic-like serine/threonine-protein kinase
MRAVGARSAPPRVPGRCQRRYRARSAPRDLEIGDTLTSPNSSLEYVLLDTLGEGSFGVTYRARASSGDIVALKTFTLRDRTRARDANVAFKAVELFEREAKTLRALTCDAVPAYVDHFELDSSDDVRFVLVQKLAKGVNLEVLVRDEGWRPTEAEAKDILKQLLEILDVAASLRPPVIHRDVKPANVLLDRDTMKVSLVDFGASAAAAIDSDASASTIVGTFGYMAPEQLVGGASARTDQYGVGATTLYLLSGRAPAGFKSTRLKVDFRSEVYIEDAQFAEVLERLLEPSPEDRFESPRDAVDALVSRAMLSGRNFKRRPRDDDVIVAPYAPRGVAAPASMKTTLIRDDVSLTITIPPSGVDAKVLYEALFDVTWIGITAVWTAGVIASGAWLMALFSLPFWKVGADLTGQVVRSCVARGRVVIDDERYLIAFEGAKMTFLEKTGDTSSISRAVVRADGLVLVELDDDSAVPILADLRQREAEYLASEINAFVGGRRKSNSTIAY